MKASTNLIFESIPTEAPGTSSPQLQKFAKKPPSAPMRSMEQLAFLGSRADRSQICDSVIAQLDGLVFILLARRIEVDFFASSAELAYGMMWGYPLPLHSPINTVFGLYYLQPEYMYEVIQHAINENAAGVFITPGSLEHEIDAKLIANEEKKSKKLLGYLFNPEYLLLKFNISGDCLVDPSTKQPLPSSMQPPHGMTAYVVNFKYVGKFKRKRRPKSEVDPQKGINLAPITRPASHCQRKAIDYLPFVPTRVAPEVLSLAEWKRKHHSSDTAQPTDHWDQYEDSVDLPEYPANTYNLDAFISIAAGYPFEDVADLAIGILEEGVDPGFVGDLNKAVIRPNYELRPEELERLNKHLHKEAQASRVIGPFERPPVPSVSVAQAQPRSTPLYFIPKDKHDPANKEKRLISDFSAGKEESINSQCWSPRLLAYYSSAGHICDTLAHMGENAGVWACDIPKCFRRQRVLPGLLALFVYAVLSAADGFLQYWVDVRCPFGWTPSEWA